MKVKIHPTYFADAQVTCVCGNKFTTGSTTQVISVDTCMKCHPLYTGEHRFIDTQGKVERFKQKQKFAAEMQVKLKASKGKKEDKTEKKSKSLRELLAEG